MFRLKDTFNLSLMLVLLNQLVPLDVELQHLFFLKN